MPLLNFARSLATLLSLAILALGIYLLFDWHHGELIREPGGVVRLHRDGWKLWTGVALLAWSFLGRLPLLLLLAKADRDPVRARRGEGRLIQSPTGATLYLEDHGSSLAQPLILTHGWSMDSTFWSYAKRDLIGTFRILVWDLPGLGRSRRGHAGVSLSGFAEDLKAVAAQVGDAKPILVGHSIGGMVIETLARDDPDWFGKHVAGVALFNTTYADPLRTMVLGGLFRALRKPLVVPMLNLQILLSPLVWAANWQSYLSGSLHLSTRLGFGRFVTRSQLDLVARLIAKAPPAVVARGDLAMIRWDGSAGTAKLTPGALVLAGAVDLVTKAEASHTIAAAAPSAHLRVIEGANHMGPLECREAYHEAILAWSAGGDGGGAAPPA